MRVPLFLVLLMPFITNAEASFAHEAAKYAPVFSPAYKYDDVFSPANFRSILEGLGHDEDSCHTKAGCQCFKKTDTAALEVDAHFVKIIRKPNLKQKILLVGEGRTRLVSSSQRAPRAWPIGIEIPKDFDTVYTTDIDEETGPDLHADFLHPNFAKVWLPQTNHKFDTIILEFLPSDLFMSKHFYVNIMKLLSDGDAKIYFVSEKQQHSMIEQLLSQAVLTRAKPFDRRLTFTFQEKWEPKKDERARKPSEIRRVERGHQRLLNAVSEISLPGECGKNHLDKIRDTLSRKVLSVEEQIDPNAQYRPAALLVEVAPR